MEDNKAIIKLTLTLHLFFTRSERYGGVKEHLHAFLTSPLGRVLNFTCRLFQRRAQPLFSTGKGAVWAPEQV
jgi:hypothetical protein